jgi:hypothetical protein
MFHRFPQTKGVFMELKASLTEKIATYLAVGLATCAAICFCAGPVASQSSQAPIVDTQKSSPNTTLSREQIEKLPIGSRDFSKLAVLLPAENAAALAPKVLPESAPGFITTFRTPPGLNTIVFTTPEKDTIEIYLPNRVSTSGTFTATMKLIPNKSKHGRDQLKDYSLSIEEQRYPLGDGLFNATLPDDQTARSAKLLLLDKNGKAVGGVEIPLWPHIGFPLSSAPTLPSSGTSGNTIVVYGPYSGMLQPDDYLMIGGKPMPLLASGGGRLVALNTYDIPGLTLMETRIENELTKKVFRNVMLKVSADKLNLLKGESTIVHIVVGGLEKLKAPATMTVDATGVVTMSGGNSQRIKIDPSDVKPDGTYTTSDSLFANSAGTFGVQVTVTVPEEKP